MPHKTSHVLSPLAFALGVFLILDSPAFGQTPLDPNRTWRGTAGAGLALTSGNSDTLTFNVAFDVTHDPGARNEVKWSGLFLRGTQQEVLVSNRLSLAVRDQFAFNTRAFVFGQVEYLRDTFKLIDYLVAPTAGVGFKLRDSDTTKMTLDAGVGGVWEKNPELGVRTNGAITAAEKLEHQLTANATIKHALTALWTANDLADGLYTASISLGTKITERLQLSVDLLDTFKNRPPTPTTRQNDVALVTALTATF